ncbi:MAG: hypothetical protein M0002_06545 [Rhodospirillales bacterium]|nr:hypothetical protein [Rhodospirillales bacterium]
MLDGAFAILFVAVALGTVLALLHLRPGRRPPPWQLGALHGLIAAAGLAALFLSLGGPPRGLTNGTAPFGEFAATLLVLALLAGLGILAMLYTARRPGLLIAVHAALAVTGFVILAAYVLAS